MVERKETGGEQRVEFIFKKIWIWQMHRSFIEIFLYSRFLKCGIHFKIFIFVIVFNQLLNRIFCNHKLDKFG